MDKIFSIALLLDESFLNISIKKAVPPKEIQFLYVIPLRFERKTHALEGRCSIQLSYGTYSTSKRKVNSNKYEKRKTLYMNLFQPIPPNSYTSMRKRTEL